MASPEELAAKMMELTDAADWSAREALFTEDIELVTPAAQVEGRAATTAFSAALVGAFSDARHSIDVIAAAGEVVLVEGVWNGVHSAPLVTPDGEIPATGRTLRLPFAVVFGTTGDLISSVHVYWDQMTFLGQLGLIPQPQAA